MLVLRSMFSGWTWDSHVGGDRHVFPAPVGERRGVELEFAARGWEAAQDFPVDTDTDRPSAFGVISGGTGRHNVELGRGLGALV